MMGPGISSFSRRLSAVCLVLLACLILLLPVHASPDQGKLVYSTDFSTDPGWSTNNPATNHYDAGKGVFHYLMRDGSGAYVNVPVTYHGESFTLSFDILPERTDYQASVKFGLGDNDQVTQERLTMFTEFENGPYGRIIWLRSIDGQNQRREVSSYFLSYGGPTVQFTDGEWYHVIMDYSLEKRSLTLSVYRRNGSSPLWHNTLDSMSIFPTMNRIYMSKIGDSRNPSAIAEGSIDNVAFSLPLPPETPLPAGPGSTSPVPVIPVGTKEVSTAPPAQGSQASEPVPLPVLPALAALCISMTLAGAGRAGRR
jgi:hypothetical protein